MRVFVLDWDGPLPRAQLLGDRGREVVPLRSLGLDAVVTFIPRLEDRATEETGREEAAPLVRPRLAEMACIA